MYIVSVVQFANTETHTYALFFLIYRTKPPAPFTVNYSGKPHHSHHKHKHRRHNKASTKDLIDRRHLGSEVQLNEGLRRIPTETEEAVMLSGLDLDEMSSK